MSRLAPSLSLLLIFLMVFPPGLHIASASSGAADSLLKSTLADPTLFSECERGLGSLEPFVLTEGDLRWVTRVFEDLYLRLREAGEDYDRVHWALGDLDEQAQPDPAHRSGSFYVVKGNENVRAYLEGLIAGGRQICEAGKAAGNAGCGLGLAGMILGAVLAFVGGVFSIYEIFEVVMTGARREGFGAFFKEVAWLLGGVVVTVGGAAMAVPSFFIGLFSAAEDPGERRAQTFVEVLGEMDGRLNATTLSRWDLFHLTLSPTGEQADPTIQFILVKEGEEAKLIVYRGDGIPGPDSVGGAE